MPDYSIIIPARTEDDAKEAIARARGTIPPGVTAELLLALGENPSRQRNAAAAEATGQFLIFLDNDCKVDASFWKRLAQLHEEYDFDVAGGPVLLDEHTYEFEQAAQAALANPKVTGESAARYAPLGPTRRGNQRNLILANMVVRREVFEAGNFDERLYPNEENEWLDRLERTVPAARVIYDPGLAVGRPQRATAPLLHQAFMRYGAGRAKQTRLAMAADTLALRVFANTLGLLFVACVFLFYMPVVSFFAVLVGGIAWLFRIYSNMENVPDNLRMTATLQGMMISLWYVLGFWMGALLKWPDGTLAERWKGDVKVSKERLGGEAKSTPKPEAEPKPAATPPAVPTAAAPAPSATKAPPPPEI